MSWKRPLLVYPYGPTKRSEQLYGGIAVINPIGLEVVATALKKAGIEPMVVDIRREKKPLGEIISRFKPDLIGVSINWGLDENVDALIHDLPENVTLVIGGLYVTRQPEVILEKFPEVDILAMGYGEDSMVELVRAGRPEEVNGLWYRRQAGSYSPANRDGLPLVGGELVKNERRSSVDVRNFHVDRSLRRYWYPFMALKGDNVITSLGCPNVCTFCKWRENIFGDYQPYVAREPEDVVDELAEIDADIVHIVDANFAADPKRVERICDLIIQRDIKHLYACEIRVNALLRGELVRKMEQAGFFMFMIGVETYQDRLLKLMRKGFTQRTVRRAFENLRGLHILTLGNFLIGSPGETEQDMLGVAPFARSIGLDFISPNKIYAYADTDFENWVLSHPGYRIEGRRRYIVSDDYGIEDLRKIQAKIMLRFFRWNDGVRIYRKALGHPMARKLGRERLGRAILRTFYNHIADTKFRRRLFKKLGKRFQRWQKK
ncbi:MAG: radical SAM protein [Planctomycetia bacterium]|nr:radical SAM protein [Planctomycetia bacterium]